MVRGDFKFIYIFSDGSYMKKKNGKLYYRRLKKFGPPILVFESSIISHMDTNRRMSIADDINQDIIWIQRTNPHKRFKDV